MTLGTDATVPVEAKVRKFPCVECGADVVWSPGASAVECPYCGARRQIAGTAGTVRERPIEQALGAARDLGWGTERKVVGCGKCGAKTTFDPSVAAGACAFCGTASVVIAPADESMVRPEGLLPFQIDRSTAVQKFSSWLRGLWLRPNDLKKKSNLTKIQGVYIPFWTFDAATDSSWTAEAGFYYYVPVSRMRNGRHVTQMERRVRWEHASGTLERFFDDLPVPASKGIEHDLCEQIEPFPTSQLVPYDPAYLAGFGAEEYAIDLEPALATARQRMDAEIREECAAAIPGDTHRNLDVVTSVSGIAIKNALLPVWIAAYEYAGKPYRFLVNGVTGKVSGRAPWSIVKIGLIALAAVIVLILIANA